MGCFSSRFDKRASAYASDYNTVGLAFIGGEKGRPYDKFPCDRVAWAHDIKAEITDSCPADAEGATKDEFTTVAYASMMTGLKEVLAGLEKKHGSASDSKVEIVGNRYEAQSAIANLKEAIAHLQEQSGIAHGEEEKKAEEPAPEGEKKEENEMGGDEMEGGDGDEAEKKDEGMGMEEAAKKELTNPHAGYADDGADYKGVGKVPLALLRNMIVNPVVGDIVKNEVMKFEFNHAKCDAKKSAYAGVAGLLGHLCSKKQAGDSEFWLSGHLSAQDLEAMNAITKDLDGENSALKNIHFPFLTFGWASEDEARQALAWDAQHIKNESSYHKTIFKVSGAKSFKFVNDKRVVAHKINGTVDKPAEPVDGVTTYEVTATPMEEKTVQQWKDDVEAEAKAAAEAAKAAAEPKKEEEKPADMGEGENMAEEKAEEPAAE